MIDRGKLSGFPCTEKDIVTGWSGDNPEWRANRFAADLLLPTPIVTPPLPKNREITFATLTDLAKRFETSLTATAIRLVNNGSFPAMVANSTGESIKWKYRDRDIPAEFQLQDRPGIYTNAADLLLGKDPKDNPTGILSCDWFIHPQAKHYKVVEDSIQIVDGKVLSLIGWKNVKQPLDIAVDCVDFGGGAD